jgi:hypothetical protein
MNGGLIIIMSPLQKVRTLATRCRALKRLERRASPPQCPNRPNERKHRRIRRLLHPHCLPLPPSFRSPFRLRWPYSGLPEAVQPPDIDHRRRANDHTGHTQAAPYRGFPSRKGMFHPAHRGFYHRPQLPPTLPMLAGATPSLGSLQRFGPKAQNPLARPFPPKPPDNDPAPHRYHRLAQRPLPKPGPKWIHSPPPTSPLDR